MVLADDTTCFRHDDQPAAVSCQRCERPICPRCMVQASVGFHCPPCARSGAQRVIPARAVLRRSDRPPVTTTLLALNVVAFLVQRATDRGVSGVSIWGLLFGPAVQAGEWWRLVTSGFLHGGLLHIGFNCYALWLFGPPLERMLGPARFALTYLGGLLGGSLAVVAFNYGQRTLGASGAVLGLAGALAAALWARGVKPGQTSLGGIFVINLALPLLVGGISFWGHLGGIAGGFATGWLLTWLPERYGQSLSVATAAAAALCATLFALGVATAAAGGV